MPKQSFNNLAKVVINIFIALVWLINGLFCKVLNWVPRHQLIVSHILGDKYAFIATKAIGALEVLMAIWILSKIKSRFCATVQIIIVLLMNIIEFLTVPELLLFGRTNIIFAVIFAIVIYGNEFLFGNPRTLK